MQKTKQNKKPVRRRPVPKWKLYNSIKYIKMRDAYLQKTGTLKKIDERNWKLDIP